MRGLLTLRLLLITTLITLETWFVAALPFRGTSLASPLGAVMQSGGCAGANLTQPADSPFAAGISPTSTAVWTNSGSRFGTRATTTPSFMTTRWERATMAIRLLRSAVGTSSFTDNRGSCDRSADQCQPAGHSENYLDDDTCLEYFSLI